MPARPYTVGTCAHCRRAVRLRNRGLCSRCYDYPDRRALYPLDGPPAETANPILPLPACATTAPPGTRAKVEALEARVKAGCGLWHPGDASDLEGATVTDLLDKEAENPRARCAGCRGRFEADGFRQCPACRTKKREKARAKAKARAR